LRKIEALREADVDMDFAVVRFKVPLLGLLLCGVLISMDSRVVK
jgi:hypothetical protein